MSAERRAPLAMTEAVVVTDLPAADLSADLRHAMYMAVFRDLGLPVTVISMADAIAPEVASYGDPVRDQWARNLALYDRLHGHRDALILCRGLGTFAFGVILTFAYRGNRIILDYDGRDLGGAEQGFDRLAARLPSFAGESLLATVASASAACVAASKPLDDAVRPLAGGSALLWPTTVPGTATAAPYSAAGGRIRVGWSGRIDSVEDARELLVALDCVAHLPDRLRDRVSVLISGSGALWPRVHELIAANQNITIERSDRGSVDGFLDWLGNLDLLLLPWPDDAGGATRDAGEAIAALAASVPVCATAVGELARLFASDAAVRLAPSVDALAECVAEALESGTLRTGARATAAEIAQRFPTGPDSALGRLVHEVAAGEGPPYRNADLSKSLRDGRRDAWIQADHMPDLFR